MTIAFTFDLENVNKTVVGNSFDVTLKEYCANNYYHLVPKMQELLKVYQRYARLCTGHEKSSQYKISKTYQTLQWTRPGTNKTCTNKAWSPWTFMSSTANEDDEMIYRVYGYDSCEWYWQNGIYRRIWRLKVVDYEPNKPINMTIKFVDQYDQWFDGDPIMNTLCDDDTKSKNDTIFWGGNKKRKSLLKVGDFISIVCVYSQGIDVLFGINDVEWKRFDKVDMSHVYKLMIIVNDSVKLGLLTD